MVNTPNSWVVKWNTQSLCSNKSRWRSTSRSLGLKYIYIYTVHIYIYKPFINLFLGSVPCVYNIYIYIYLCVYIFIHIFVYVYI